jgi:peptidylprolyl isomerase
MTSVKSGDTVQLHYAGSLDDGSVFDTSEGRDPLTFEVGSGMVIPGFDTAVNGMGVGDSKTFKIEAADAYGERQQEAVQVVPLDKIPDEVQLFAGAQLQAESPDGQPIQLTVTELNDETVTLDANHPLAGQRLTFKVELLKIVETD